LKVLCFFNRGGERNDSNGLIIEFLGFKKYPMGGGDAFLRNGKIYNIVSRV